MIIVAFWVIIAVTVIMCIVSVVTAIRFECPVFLFGVQASLMLCSVGIRVLTYLVK